MRFLARGSTKVETGTDAELGNAEHLPASAIVKPRPWTADEHKERKKKMEKSLLSGFGLGCAVPSSS